MECWKTGARRQFDAWSSSYDRSLLQWLFFRPSHDLLLKHIVLRPGARVFDVGCGTGLFVRRLLTQNPLVTAVGLDLSEAMLAQAAANCAAVADRLELIRGDSEVLPFATGSFDVVTCIHSFHHYPHQQPVIREMFRVLKPGGQLCLLDANRDGWWGWLVFDGVVAMLEGGVHHCSGRQFRQLMWSEGFAAVEQVGGGWVAPFLLTCAIAPTSKQRTLPAAA